MKYHQSGQSDQGNKQPLTLNILGWGAGGGGVGIFFLVENLVRKHFRSFYIPNERRESR